MAQIPGVPTLDPVNKPMMSPTEAGKGGKAVAAIADATQDVALQSQDFNIFLRKAQEHVDSLAAQNELAKVYADTQNSLLKTQNSRDVAGVIEQSNKTLNEVSAQWSKSPASVGIQMSADALRPDLTRIGTVKQVDLMSKEFKVTIQQQAETLTGTYANDRTSGGNGDMALGAFATAVHGGVTTGLIGDVEAQDMVRRFKQGGQEQQIRNGITNANPEVNQRTYDDITQNRDKYPDVTQETLDTLKGQALSAFEAHTKMQDWAEGQMALKTQLVPKIQQFTNPATGNFDEGAAMTDNADRFAKGEITKTQADVLASSFNSHATQLNVQLRQQADKTKNDIVEMFHKNDYKGASAMLEAHKNDPEFGEQYEGLTKYGDQVQRERRAEGREEYALSRQLQTEQSNETMGNILASMAQGHVFTDAQIYGMAGQGKGKLKSSDAMEVIRASKAYEADPSTRAAMDLMTTSFPMKSLPKSATAEEVAGIAEPNARQSKYLAETYQAWQQRVNQNPNEDKVEAMNAVLKPAVQKQIAQRVDEMFGVQSQQHIGFWERVKNAHNDKTGGFLGGLPDLFDSTKTVTEKPTNPPQAATRPRPANVPENYSYNANGPNGAGWYAPTK